MKRAAALWAACLLAVSGSVYSSPQEGEKLEQLTRAQWIYLERCGGCHGIQGRSAPKLVPSLRDQIGYFLCTPETRAYLIRLPSVATAPVPDDVLADLMNFVVFQLGAADKARGEEFTAAEVAKLRAQPLKDVSLAGYRAELVERLISDCGAPTSLREYSSVRSR